MTVEKAHTGEHYDDDHVDAEKHMTDFVLSGPFLIEILADGGLRVCHISLQILRLLLFSLILVKPRWLLLLLLLLVLMLLSIIKLIKRLGTGIHNLFRLWFGLFHFVFRLGLHLRFIIGLNAVDNVIFWPFLRSGIIVWLIFVYVNELNFHSEQSSDLKLYKLSLIYNYFRFYNFRSFYYCLS